MAKSEKSEYVNNWFIPMLALIVIMLGGFYLTANAVAQSFGLAPVSTTVIDVSGSADMTATPDVAYLSISIETDDENASISQSMNAEIYDAIIAQLTEMGIKEEKIKSSYYAVRENWEWVPIYYGLEDKDDLELLEYAISSSYYGYDEERVFMGYTTCHDLRIEVTDFELMGEMVDMVVAEGALVDYISFDLTDETRESLQNQLISEAVLDAKLKANSIAQAAGMSLGKMSSANYGNANYYPYYSYDYKEALSAVDSSEEAGTSFSAGELELSVSISASFEAN